MKTISEKDYYDAKQLELKEAFVRGSYAKFYIIAMKYCWEHHGFCDTPFSDEIKYYFEGNILR